jgi:hypothetical protein
MWCHARSNNNISVQLLQNVYTAYTQNVVQIQQPGLGWEEEMKAEVSRGFRVAVEGLGGWG